MDPVGILLEAGPLHSAVDTALTVVMSGVFVFALAMFAAGWRQDRRDARQTDTCPCGCGVLVTEECRSLMEQPPPPVPPIYAGKHRRETGDRPAADTGRVRGAKRVPARADARDRAWAVAGWCGPFTGPGLLNVWGVPPDNAWGVPGDGGAKPLPGRAGSAVAAAGSESAFAAYGAECATTATDLPASA